MSSFSRSLKILAIDTCCNTCSVCVAAFDPNPQTTSLTTETSLPLNLLHYSEQLIHHKQVEDLVPMIQKVVHNSGFSYHDIDYLVVTNGPGSFTGVRIGLSSCYGIYTAIQHIHKKPIIFIAFTTLEVMVHDFIFNNVKLISANKSIKFTVFLEAGRNEHYMQLFEIFPSEKGYVCINSITEIELIDNERKLSIINDTLENEVENKGRNTKTFILHDGSIDIKILIDADKSKEKILYEKAQEMIFKVHLSAKGLTLAAVLALMNNKIDNKDHNDKKFWESVKPIYIKHPSVQISSNSNEKSR